MESSVLNLLNKRFSCRNYSAKEPEEEKIKMIIEAGRLAPSSFGLEPWKFHVARSSDLLSACPGQPSMKTAPITIVITAVRAGAYSEGSDFIEKRAPGRYGSIDAYREDFGDFGKVLKERHGLDAWSVAQCYIAAAYMVLEGTELGIESCIIEGFDNDKVTEALGLSGEEEQVALVIAFGYPAEEPGPKVRAGIDEIAVYHSKGKQNGKNNT